MIPQEEKTMLDQVIKDGIAAKVAKIKIQEEQLIEAIIKERFQDPEIAELFRTAFNSARDSFRKKLFARTIECLSDLQDCTDASVLQMIQFKEQPRTVDLIAEISNTSRAYYITEMDKLYKEYAERCGECAATLTLEFLCIEDDP